MISMRCASLFAYLSIDCSRDIKIVNAKEKPMTCLGKTENTASDFDAPPSIRPLPSQCLIRPKHCLAIQVCS